MHYFRGDRLRGDSYIRNPSKIFSVYIINRSYKIKLNSNVNESCFIPRKNNPADHCTCYTHLTSLTLNSLWIKGSHFLYKNESVSFESQISSADSEGTDLISHLIAHCKPPYLSFIKSENYSLFFKSVQRIVCILKLKHHWMNKKEKLSKNVYFKKMTVKKFFYAEDQIFLEVQHESYPMEINGLKNN